MIAVTTTHRPERLEHADLVVDSPRQLSVRSLDALGIEVVTEKQVSPKAGQPER